MTLRSRKLLDQARGQPCQNCGIEDGTIVAAHPVDYMQSIGRLL